MNTHTIILTEDELNCLAGLVEAEHQFLSENTPDGAIKYLVASMLERLTKKLRPLDLDERDKGSTRKRRSSPSRDRVMALMADGYWHSYETVGSRCGKSSLNWLVRLVESGVLIRRGKRGQYQYKLAHKEATVESVA